MYISPTPQASHIINIFQREQVKPANKGNLYLSGVYCLNQQLFLDLNIKCMLSIIDTWGYNKFKLQQKLQEAEINQHKWFNLEDQEDLSIYSFLADAHAYIKQMLANHNVLVHCQMGKSRSASLVIAFIMKQYGKSYQQARTFIKSKRDMIQPNKGFQKDLLKFQASLRENSQNIFQK